MSLNTRKTLWQLTLKPLRIVTAPYRHWTERQQLARVIQEAQRKIAESTNEDLARFHDMLWSHWPDTVQHIREDIRKEEIPDE
jgi:hypothetical protein